jgi:hypothetical protein
LFLNKSFPTKPDPALESPAQTTNAATTFAISSQDLHFPVGSSLVVQECELHHYSIFAEVAGKCSEARSRIEELCSGEQAPLFVRGLTLAHFDAVLKGIGASWRFWDQDIPGELKRRGVDAFRP